MQHDNVWGKVKAKKFKIMYWITMQYILEASTVGIFCCDPLFY